MPFFLHDFAAVLTPEDLDAMPEGLRRSFDVWHAQHRALTGAVHAQVPARTALDEIAREMLRVIAGLAPATTIGPWLDRFDGAAGRAGTMIRHPSALVNLAVAGRNLDLLNAVLDRPTFCPGSTSTRLRTLRQPERGADAETFDGSLAVAYGHRTRLGLEVPLLALQMVSLPAPGSEPLLHPEDPLSAWCRAQAQEENAWDEALCAVPARGERDGFRQQVRSNLVGQAVLMGWADGVLALLNHDVDPYATTGKEQEFTSPLVLAGYHGELDGVQALMGHTSFRIGHRFGFTDAEVERRRVITDDPAVLWGRGRPAPNFPEAGGLDVEFVLRAPALVSDPLVQDLILVRLQAMPRTAQQRFRHELSEAGRRGLERVELQATVRNVPIKTMGRARPRL